VSETHILCDNVVRIYKSKGIEVVALQGLDLTVERGELMALVGASGSGKSTLLNILSGLDVPTAGLARVGGQDLLAMSRKDRLRFRRHVAGFVWQQTHRNLVPYLTAAENVAVPMLTARVGGAERRTRVRELLELLGVADIADRRPADLSGGQRQRIAIAVALANRPEVMFADEPTGELDSAASREVLAAFRAVNRELGTTVVVVTHDPSIAEHVQRTIGLRDGRISSEVLRRGGEDGLDHENVIAEEYAVLDRVGRLQLPREFTDTLQMERRVRLELEPDHIGVWPDRPPQPEGRGSQEEDA
jgi:ABC-type lipoprotein export system ATPase subunit